MCINCRCCLIVVKGFIDFIWEQLWETNDHTHASPIAKNTILNTYANCVMAAILDCIAKLLHMHQLQMLPYCCYRFHWFQLRQLWETIDHTHAFPIAENTILNNNANCIMVAILDWIAKLLHMHQLQMLLYCGYRFHWYQLRATVRNHWSHTCISLSHEYNFEYICKLRHGSHLRLNCKTIAHASTTDVALLLLQVSLI